MPKGEKIRKLGPAEVDELVRRYTTRLPDGTWEGTVLLAREFDVRPPTVNRWLRLRGVQIRSARESHSGGKRCKPIRNLPAGTGGLPQRTSYPATIALPGGPLCKCGCGGAVLWNRRKAAWAQYVAGHYRKPAPYKDADWLREQYITKRRTTDEIAAECAVSKPTLRYYMRLHGIEARSISEARMGRKVGAKNPAWKGGVADWPYSPDWKMLARQIRARDKWTCQDCGEQRKRWGIYLHVHHIDGNKLNNDPANLISLCAKCHNDRHRAGNLGDLENVNVA